jgi:hypothetical protein
MATSQTQPSITSTRSDRDAATKLFRTRLALASIDPKTLPAPKSDKYSSIQSMQRAQKIEALKDPHLDPAKIQDPYDTLTHVYHTWTQVVQKIKNAPNSSDIWRKDDVIASNYYDAMLLPAYAKAKLIPIAKDLWMKQAYNQAATYNIDDAYENNFAHDLRNGWNSGLASTARGFGRVSNMLGNAADDVVALWKSSAAKNPDELQKPWHEQLADFHNVIANTPHTESYVGKGAKIQDEYHQFWADALPTRNGFWNKTTSMVAEGVANTPAFAAMELAPEVAGGNLTAKLATSPAGKRIISYLTAGASGLAYGAATHKQDDPGEAWRDAIGFTVFHGLFDVGGPSLKWAAKKVKLIDIAPESWKPKLAAIDYHLDLAKQGLTEDTPDQVYDRHKTEVANNIAVTGVPGQQLIFRSALQHVDDMQHFAGMSDVEIHAHEQANLERDPAHWAPVLSAAKFIRDWLGDRKLADLKPEEEKELGQKIAKLIYDSSAEIGSRVIDAPEHAVEKAATVLKQPSATHTLEYYQKKAQAELAKAPGASGLVTPEQIQKYAEKLYAEDSQKATAKAEETLSKNPIDEATKAANAIRKRPTYKIRSERTTDKYGQPAARYNIVPDYKVRLRQYVVAAKEQGKTLSEFFRDMDDSDFIQDLNDHFYPKSLRQAEVFFEHQNTREGMQNPNFLAFMYNYLNQMPKEFGQELEQRLTDSMKAQQYMKGRSPIEPQLSYYAKSMYNHVDNFLGSGRWPKEHNLFRSSNDSIFQTTQWQRELLIEKHIQETKNLKQAFTGKARQQALAAYDGLWRARLDEFDNASMKRNSQDKIKSLDAQIADKITETGKFDRWEF